MPNIVSPTKYSLFTFPCPMWMHLHFPKLNNICHFSDHMANLARSFHNVFLSASVFTVLNTFVSFANLRTLLDKSSSKSFMNIEINTNPNTDPCGTTLKTRFQFDISPSTITLCLLSINHVCIQLIILSPIPKAFSLI